MKKAFEILDVSYSFEDSMIKTINENSWLCPELSCLVGSILGLKYGYNSIPKRWINSIRELNGINKLIGMVGNAKS